MCKPVILGAENGPLGRRMLCKRLQKGTAKQAPKQRAFAQSGIPQGPKKAGRSLRARGIRYSDGLRR